MAGELLGQEMAGKRYEKGPVNGVRGIKRGLSGWEVGSR
jgi:hypothetical protein